MLSGHAARNEGVNALYLALDAIQTLRNFRFERESASLGPIKVTTTNIQAGQGQHNVIPDTCGFVVDVRTTDAYAKEDEIKEVIGSRKFDQVTINPLGEWVGGTKKMFRFLCGTSLLNRGLIHSNLGHLTSPRKGL